MTKIKRLYKEIWQEREPFCEVCGYRISRPVSHVFSHVYSKGAHPSLKYVKDNVQIWCSTLVRHDGQIGCHEAHHTKPEVFNRRKRKHNWQKPALQELKQKAINVN